MGVCRSEAADDIMTLCAAERSHGSYGQIASSVPGESVQVVTMHSWLTLRSWWVCPGCYHALLTHTQILVSLSRLLPCTLDSYSLRSWWVCPGCYHALMTQTDSVPGESVQVVTMHSWLILTQFRSSLSMLLPRTLDSYSLSAGWVCPCCYHALLTHTHSVPGVCPGCDHALLTHTQRREKGCTSGGAGKSYRRRLRSLLLCSFRALINSLVCWFFTSALGLVLFQFMKYEVCTFLRSSVTSTQHSLSCLSSLFQTSKTAPLRYLSTRTDSEANTPSVGMIILLPSLWIVHLRLVPACAVYHLPTVA